MAFSEPSKIVDEFGIREGLTVVDLGAGTGFYTIAAAKAVGEHGKVYAVDIQQELLSRIKTVTVDARLHNVHVVHGDVEHPHGTRLADNIADVGIAANVVFQLEHKDNFVKEALRILKSGARLLFVDWSDSFGGMGPQPESVVTREAARELFEKNGFAFASSIRAGDHHYALIFRKP
jgi:ubiquinone/menaquinone biosynthesis C-methylase UbiE